MFVLSTYSADQLSGQASIVNTIQGMLNNQVAYHIIEKVILEVNKAEDGGVEYDTSWKMFIKKQCKKANGFEMHLPTKLKSAGASYNTCTAAINP